MITVLLDSSDNKLNVGIASEQEVIDFTSYEAWQTQSEYLLPELKKLLDKYGYTRNDIDSIMVGIGPGSYTGIRISITIAKVMGLALSAKVYCVSSLQILKNGKEPSICLMNARSGRSYIGVYENEKVLLKDQILTNDEVKKYIDEHPSFSICGDIKYLGLSGIETCPIKEMFSLKCFSTPIKDNLSIKPTYLKEEYAYPKR